MMNYETYPRMILRVPRFPVSKASSTLDEMQADPVFRDALYLASDSMYAELSQNDFQPSRCSDKMKHSLAKYHKRICYRPTPFGAFAGLTILPWNENKESGIVIEELSFETRLVDQSAFSPQFGDTGEQMFRVSPFLYEYGSDFRVIGKGEKGAQSTFAISEIFGSEVVRTLASNTHTLSRESLVLILRNNGVEKDEIEWYIRELNKLQIILPYQKTRSFPHLLNPKQKEKSGSAYDSYTTFSAHGYFPERTKQKLHDAIYCLDKLSTKYESPALSGFKNRFEKLFERREVSLLQALDPELGIDYDGLSSPSQSPSKNKRSESIAWSPLHELLLAKWTTQAGRGISEIEILEKELSVFDISQRNYPPAYSVLFSLAGDKLHIKAAGGVSTLNMIGRFTVLDPGIRDLGKNLAGKEMEYNPDVLFAELSHIDGPEVASVSRKTTVYDYQIPFFESLEVPDDFLIRLNDLYISQSDSRLILRSASLNKQVIPRFSSAYNYQKSTLPVFRFLCDLQHEGTDSNLNFSMASLFPGVPAYPRVTYKGVILEAASWRIDAKDLSALKKLEPAAQFHAFSSFAAQVGLPAEFSYEVHDQLLHINLFSEQDISLLLKAIPASGKIVLREYYKSQEALIKDAEGNSHTHECLAFLINKEESYKCTTENMEVQMPLLKSREKLFPFDDWLYFKIYLHPAGYKDLLVNYIQPFILENVREGNISSWFFISYYDDDFHLRVRMKEMAGRESYLLKTYKKLETKVRQLPNLKKLELSTYFKERERYAIIGLETAEDLFKLSSEIVMSDLNQPDLIIDPSKDRLFSGVRHLLLVCQELGFSLAEIEGFSKAATSHLTKSQRIEYDMEFREHKRELQEFLMRNKEKNILEDYYLEALQTAVKGLKWEEKLRLVMDLNHMHLNRYYLVEQQRLEAKSYYLLCKVGRVVVKL